MDTAQSVVNRIINEVRINMKDYCWTVEIRPIRPNGALYPEEFSVKAPNMKSAVGEALSTMKKNRLANWVITRVSQGAPFTPRVGSNQ